MPPARPLRDLALLRAVIRNPLESVPAAAYVEGLVRQRFLGRERLLVTDPALVQRVLLDEADAFGKAEAMRRALAPALGDAILTADGERWRWQRRAAAPAFRHEQLLGVLPEMIAAAGRTRDRWLARLEAGAAGIELGHEMMRTTFDIILATMLPGEEGLDVARVERGITDYLDSTSWAIALALLKAPAWVPYPGQARAAASRDHLRAEILRIVAAARARGEDGRRDLASRLVAARDPETGQGMSDRDVADNLLTFITAGHETTALALTWTFYLLALHPGVEARLLREIDALTGGGPLRPEHLPGLAYGRQVLQEAMRLYPPAPLVVRTALRDMELGGEALRAGTPVYVPVYAIHRHRALWAEPDRFDPDRFAPGAPARHRFAYLPFGAGPRICIGAGFAMLEAAAILAVLLPALRLSLPPGAAPTLRMRITLRPARGMPMRVARRGA
ncbi:cytochrome P450 [Roseomonas sp. OT10]|uniref:cytochrome P450 n=1 Tax=Roseomonas cutis TaxID=2897332 RepID=UPI001E34FA09|nr:cytochrome P450 [Roseomonas sp. OT10]UFN47312.1 cytochrome P450 [Roseomonas sp. OT10]